MKKLICVVFSVGILIVCAEDEKREGRLFKLLRKLDSIKRYKRQKAYEGLLNFLYENPIDKYIDILKRRSKRVRLEQKLLLQDLVYKFGRITAHLKKMHNNYFLQQCPKMRGSAIDFILGGGIFNINRTTFETRRVPEYFSQSFFYSGLFRDNFAVVPRDINIYDIDALLNDENNKLLWARLARWGQDVGRWFELVNHYGLADIFVYAKLRGALKKVASNLLPYLCFKNIPPHYHVTLHPRGNKQNRTQKVKSCEDFLTIFRRFLSRKSKVVLKELFKKIIINIKSRAVYYPLTQLLKFDEYLNSIHRFRLFAQSTRYRHLIQNTIERKLKKIGYLCKKVVKKVALRNGRVEDDIINYLRDNSRYGKIVENINAGCLYLYLNYPIDFSPLNNYILLRFGGIKSKGEVSQLCEKWTLSYLICAYHPLYAIRAVLSCREVDLRKFVIDSIVNFDSYKRLCDERRDYRVAYDSEVFAMRKYISALEILGKARRNIRKSIKEQYLQILNDFADRYVYYEKIRGLFEIINRIDKSYKYELAKKILVKMLSSIHLIRYKEMRLATAIILIEEILKINSAILDDEIVRKLLLRILYQEVIIDAPFQLRRYFVKIVKMADGSKIFNIMQIAQTVRENGAKYRNMSSGKSEIVLNVRMRSFELLRDKMTDSISKLSPFSPVAIYTLFILTADKNTLNVIKKRFPSYFKSKYKKLYGKILYGIVRDIFILNDAPAKKMLIDFLSKKKAFLDDIVKVLEDVSKSICNKEVEYIDYVPTYFRWLFDSDIFTILSHRGLMVKYKIIKLYPVLLSSVRSYIKLDNTLYFTTLDNLLGEKNVKEKFCGGEDCLNQYKVVFLRNTSEITIQIYRELMKLKANKYLFHNLHFYLPVIINIKSKRIIISDFRRINNIVVKVLRRHRK